MSIYTTRSMSGYPVLDSVATMKSSDLQVGDTVVTESYISTWSGSNLEPAGGGIYQIVTLANYLAITGESSVNETYDHTLDNADVAMLQRDGIKSNSQGGVAAVQDQTNVGLDINLETWNSSYNSLSIGGNSSIFSHTASAASKAIYVGQNLYFNAAGAFEYQETDQASHYQQADGNHRFSAAVSGSAGNTATMLELGLFGLSSNSAEVLSVGKNSIEAWHADYSAMQLGGNATMMASQAEGANGLFDTYHNAYYDGSPKYTSTDEASYVRQNAGVHSWSSTASGTADNTITWTETMRTGISSNGAEVLSIGKAGFEAWNGGYSVLQVGGNAAILGNQTEGAGRDVYFQQNVYYDGAWKYISTDEASDYFQQNGVHGWRAAASGTADTSITWTETMRTGISSNGAEVLSVGKASFEPWNAAFTGFQLGGNATMMANQAEGASGGFWLHQNAYYDGAWKYISTDEASYYVQQSGAHQWHYAGSGTADNTITFNELMRTDAAGRLLIGKTTTNIATSGIELSAGILTVTRSGNAAFSVNRTTNDGTLVNFYQDGTIEGTISVAGTTVSYNSFCGGHWSQLSSNTKDYDFKKGMVVETIDEKCEWLDEEGNQKDNDQLVRFKKSDKKGSKRVYGIFSNWDEDDDYNDAIVHGVGATEILVTGKCEGGDLLESNGDGTAIVQLDDIIKSSTIGKVTMGCVDEKVCLVPCVLYCG